MALQTEVVTETVTVYIMGKRYEVPKGLTILKAMEYAGYRLVRGVGCRGGFCGACATVYRKAGDFRLRVGLACQTVIEDGMYLTQIPFYPAAKAIYDINALRPTAEAILKHYPEVTRCLQCGTCLKVCPQELDVMRYIAAAMRGDIAKAADLSFDCHPVRFVHQPLPGRNFPLPCRHVGAPTLRQALDATCSTPDAAA
jgi:succinate dehydrogenase/fumarate reductase-like Fe-S protein